MPVSILRPLAVGFYNDFALGAGADKVVAVDSGDPVTHDDNTSYIAGNVDGNNQSYTQTNKPAAGTIGSVISFKTAIRWRGTAGAGDPHTATVRSLFSGAQGAVTTFSRTMADTYFTEALTAVAKWDGTAWQGLDIDRPFEMVLRADVAAPGGIAVTTFWQEMEWAPHPGGFAFLIGQWLGPLVAVGLHEMPRLARELWLRSGTLVLPREYPAALGELRRYGPWRGQRVDRAAQPLARSGLYRVKIA